MVHKKHKKSNFQKGVEKKLQRGTALFLNAVYFLSIGIFSVYAEDPIVVDPHAPPNKQADMLRASNGVSLVNIVKPNSRGISHNLFQKFNVEKRGVVINNSREFGKSQLAGTLMGNPNLGEGSASIILNEVTSQNRSSLEGYTEIFGGRAEYILANPNGITCSGCGFINTPRVALTTGRSQWDGNRLQGLP